MLALVALLGLSLISPALAFSEFMYPGSGPRQVWRLGDVQTIRYKTNLKAYNIAIWQQWLSGGQARLGPIVFETTEGPYSQFAWPTQIYNWDLRTSNIFFFWLFEGNASNQGDPGQFENQSSAYFNITDALPSGEPPSPTSTTSAYTSAYTPAHTSQSRTLSFDYPTITSSYLDTASHKTSLSTGAIVAIAVVTSVFALALLAAVIFFLWYRSIKKHHILRLEQENKSRHSPPNPSPPNIATWTVPTAPVEMGPTVTRTPELPSYTHN